MLNNYWEEKMMAKNIVDFQEEEMEKMGIPEWMNLDCPFCNKHLPLRSIRSVSLKFNTRNMGDVVVEILCEECSKMDSIYFRQEVENVSDFAALLKCSAPTVSKPILEEDMYKLNYNNVVEKMINKQIKCEEK